MVFNRYLLLSQMNKKEMLKIPELPIYNTERYTNFSPISPDDIRPGHIYTNDSLFLYVSHFSFNKTAGYSVWDKEGEYVGTEMYSSQNIYAIVTYLNNNNFRPLDYDFEVVDPYNIEKRLLLTPHGIKNVNNVDEKYIRKKVSKLIGKGVRQVLKENISRIVKTVLKESFQEQWEEEIQIFLDGLKNGEALIDDGYVAVEWGHNESDPRFIYYKEGEDRLTDDHFSIQHSRRLYWEEISSIRDLCKRIYGVDIYIPDDEYYDELEDWEK